ncbi:hypothetical protein WA026_013651 [Henosepilachna vigintioctopunctata]|uniref:Kinesin motor domain-containing protein n=1 Tax=Henosepilachna vigintioctopunctata TaxID=420089 RepID=A0AAW1V0L4_9CUCU
MDKSSQDDILKQLLELNDEYCLQVYLRIKAGDASYEELYEIINSCTLISKIPEGSYSARSARDGLLVRKKYNFSKIYGPETRQEDLFDELVKPKLLKFINGENCTLMTYGVSSSGKTYTIVGTSREPGLLPRSLEWLFKTKPDLNCKPYLKPLSNGAITRLSQQQILKEIEIKQKILNFSWPNVDRNEHISMYQAMQSRLSQDGTAGLDDVQDLCLSIWVSFAEIYNEHIYDLLQPEVRHGTSKQKLKLGNSNGRTYVKNLTCVHVSSGLEAFQVLQYGLHYLNYAKTKINDHSSRSHSIFTIHLIQAKYDKQEDLYVSDFNFCDLAGAERSKKTMNEGNRLKESNNINTSLLVLGRCITGVRNAQKTSHHRLIPFRESKLTQIFQRALSGHEDICMMVNMNPCRALFDETQHVLNFSAIAKEIVVNPQPKLIEKQLTGLPGSTEIPEDEIERKIYEKERLIQELKDGISYYITKLEEEKENDELKNMNMRMEINAKYTEIKEKINAEFEEKYKMTELTLKNTYRQKLKEFKTSLITSMKEKDETFSPSESSDDDSEDDQHFPILKLNRKRKASVDMETITVYSSDEEDYINMWKDKVQKQDVMIVEHHKTISALKEEIEMIRSQKQLRIQQLETEVHEQELKIENLRKLIEDRKSKNQPNSLTRSTSPDMQNFFE